jgi:two-component system CheB/CheR fusion protein
MCSLNEEFVCSNEELLSANEKLETAREELEAANEQLQSLIDQLVLRNRELAQTQNSLANILNSISIPLVIVGHDLRIRWFTAPAKKLMNLQPTDVGRPLSDLNSGINAPDFQALVDNVIESAQPLEQEFHDRAGRRHDLRITPYRTEEHIIDGAVLLWVDIEPLKRVQEQLQVQASLFELSQDAIIVRGAEGTVISWNRGAEAMYGWTQDEARGKNLSTLVQNVDPPSPNLLGARADRSETWEGELKQRRRDGTERIVFSRQVVISRQDGGTSVVLEINRDITEQKRAEGERRRLEKELRLRVEELRVADRRKTEFMAMLAHELRNPLGPICNAVEVIHLAGDDPGAVQQAGAMLDRQVRQMVRLVGDLLDVTRLVAGKVVLHKERMQLAHPLHVAVESCRGVVDKYGHDLTVTIPEEPMELDADPVRLAQILANLIDNAAKFTDPGGHILVSAQPVFEDVPAPGEVMISVRDNGRGIRPELLPHVFEMFMQGDTSLGRSRSGLGVGLALVRNLVQMQGGRVEVKSEGAGQGSEFIVHLPLAPRPKEAPKMEPQPPKRNESSSKRRILVVDDNRDQADSLGKLLKLLGYEVQIVYDGNAAVDAAIDFVPDAALVDIGLPGLNGYEVARRIREQPKLNQTVLVAQTGWGEEEDQLRSREAGFNHHLVKPVSVDDLRNAIQGMEEGVPPRS